MASEDEMSDNSSGNYSHDDLDTDTKLSRPNYYILSTADIKKRQDDTISQISTLLSLSTDEASILLHRYNWDVSLAQDAWFTDENKVRIVAGLPLVKLASPPKQGRVACGICLENHCWGKMVTAACGNHWYCVGCWKGYIRSSIMEGPACLSLRCPEPSCTAAITLNMICNLSTTEDRKRYANFLIRSYVEKNRRIKWCPSPGCEFCVEFELGSANCDVQCECLTSFCWNCVEDSHRPVDCETVAKWTLKTSVEAGNTQWILSYTKPCPKCKRSIEKIDGCNHMTCGDPCKHQFCWVCLGPWVTHGGGFYNCNRYTEEAAVEDELARDQALKSLQRYTHYYERWVSHNRSRLKAVEDLRSLHRAKLEKHKKKLSSHNVEFIVKAWMQIVECRRVLQWTYTYGYYNMDEENKHKKEYFEYAQGLAEWALEQLHRCAEQEGKAYFETEGPTNGFVEYRIKLKNYTLVARNYFDRLVQALETGLEDVRLTEPKLLKTKHIQKSFISRILPRFKSLCFGAGQGNT